MNKTYRFFAGVLFVLPAALGAARGMAQAQQPVTPAIQQAQVEVELIGTITALSTTRVQLGALPVDISRAEIKDPLSLGATVKVHATFSNGIWVAREIELFVPRAVQTPPATPQPGATPRPPRNPNEMEWVGTVTQIGPNFIVLFGQTIVTTGAEWKDPIVVGDLVKVHLSLVNGTLTAREIELADDDDNEIELIGFVTQIGADFIVVGGQTISTVRAEWKDPIVVGDLVKVHLSFVNGTLTAREIELEDDDDRDDDRGRDDDRDDDNSGPGRGDDRDDDRQDDDNSGRGGGDDRDDDRDDDNSGSNSGRGRGDDDDDDHGDHDDDDDD